MSLPTDAKTRKAIPIYSGCVAYFPHALAEVARLSKIGNDQHNPGQPLHWDRSKSQDELDALMRHLTDHAANVPMDTDGVSHLAKVAWRALAMLEKELEKEVVVPRDAWKDNYYHPEQEEFLPEHLRSLGDEGTYELVDDYCSFCNTRGDGCTEYCMYGPDKDDS